MGRKLIEILSKYINKETIASFSFGSVFGYFGIPKAVEVGKGKLYDFKKRREEAELKKIERNARFSAQCFFDELTECARKFYKNTIEPYDLHELLREIKECGNEDRCDANGKVN